jgi:hypothetical protein
VLLASLRRRGEGLAAWVGEGVVCAEGPRVRGFVVRACGEKSLLRA